ncbi:MAG: gliding motility-associated-like protein, partial [Parvicellaceae bacterium]
AIAGIYTYTVGIAPCTIASNMVVSIVAAADPTITIPPSFCANESAVNLTAASAGGSWSGVGITNSVTGTFDPIIANSGIHQVIYTIAGSCGAADTILITVDQPANAGIDGSGSYCITDPIVDLSTLVAPADPGGVWTPGLSSGSGMFNPAMDPGGIYLYVVNGQGACLNDTSEVDVFVISSVNASINSAGPFCLADPAFIFTAATAGGVWSGNVFVNAVTGSFDPAVAGVGSHQIIYTISGSCGAADTISVVVGTSIAATINPQVDVCETSGLLLLSSINPGGLWGGLGITNTVTGEFDPASVGPGVYTITYSFGGGCPTSETITFTVLTDAIPTITALPVLCLNSANFLLVSSVGGGIWTGAGIQNAITGNYDPAIAGLGSHEIIYTVSGACGGADTIDIVVVDIPQATTSISDSLGCPTLFVTAAYSSSSTIVDCLWSTSTGASVNNCGPTIVPFAVPGCADLMLTLTDANGCMNSFVHPSQVCVLEPPIADFSFSPQNANEFQPEVIFTNTSVDATSYDWLINGEQFSTEDVTHSFPNSGLFNTCLAVSNASGCADTICKIVEIESVDGIYIPNSFTPNEDGRNDLFSPSIFGFAPENYEFVIYNKWGNRVWSSVVYGETWDGKSGVGNVSFKAPSEVYVWVLLFKNPDGIDIIRKRGHVTVLR